MRPYSTHQRAKQHGLALSNQQAHVSSALLTLSRSNTTNGKLGTLETYAIPNIRGQDKENATNQQVSKVSHCNYGFQYQQGETVHAKSSFGRPSIMPNQTLKFIPRIPNQHALAASTLFELSQSTVNVDSHGSDTGRAPPDSKRQRQVLQAKSTASNMQRVKDDKFLSNGNVYTARAKNDSSHSYNTSLVRHPIVKAGNRNATNKVAPPPILPPASASSAPRTMYSNQPLHGTRTKHSSQSHRGARAMTKGNIPLSFSNYKPTSRDVLLGGGGETNHHEGNKAFRSIVSRHQAEYTASRPTDKSRIAERIVSIIKDNGGMFLVKNTTTGKWVQVSNKKATEKVGQALSEGQSGRGKHLRRNHGSSATDDEPTSKRQKVGKDESVPSFKDSSATKEEGHKAAQEDKAIVHKSKSHSRLGNRWDKLLKLLPDDETSSELPVTAKVTDKAVGSESHSSSEIPTTTKDTDKANFLASNSSSSEIPAKDDGDWKLDSDVESVSTSPVPTPPAETGYRHYPRRGNRGLVKNNSSQLLIDSASPVLHDQNIRATNVGADAKPKTNKNSTEAEANIPPSTYEPTSRNVLMERGRGNSSHEGNKTFRSIVSRHQAEYRAAKNRGDKSRIARRIVGIIQNNGGMFITKNPATGEWEQVSNEKATQKTLQAIWRGHQQNKNPRRKRGSSATDDDETSSKRQKVGNDELVPSLKESHSDNQCFPDKTSSKISAKDDNNEAIVSEPRIFNDKWAALMKRYPEKDPKNKNARFPRRYRPERSLFVPS